MNSEDKRNKKMDGELLEFLMGLSEIEPYIDADMYREIFKAFRNEDGEGIINAIKSLCILIGNLRAEIKGIEKQRQDIRESWKMCSSENEKLHQELRSIYASRFGKYFRAKSLYEKNGYSLSKIAGELNLNRETVKKYLTSLGVKIRDNKSGRPKSQVKGLQKYDGLYVDIDEIATGIE